MRRVLRALRPAAGVVLGLFTGGAVLLAMRAVGESIATAADSIVTTLILTLGWFGGAAAGCRVASRVAKSHTPAVIVGAWLFSTVWLSPAVRPAGLGLRILCAIAVGIGGFAGGRVRQPNEPPKRATAL